MLHCASLLLAQERGFSSFLRLGSLKRIDKAILSHSLHQAGDDGKSDSLAILKEMLQEAQSGAEAAGIRWGRHQVGPASGLSRCSGQC